MLNDAHDDQPDNPKPQSNRIALDASEAAKIKGIASKLRKDTEELEQEAYNLRLQYLQAGREEVRARVRKVVQGL